jgi:hypothetical protein
MQLGQLPVDIALRQVGQSSNSREDGVDSLNGSTLVDTGIGNERSRSVQPGSTTLDGDDSTVHVHLSVSCWSAKKSG